MKNTHYIFLFICVLGSSSCMVGSKYASPKFDNLPTAYKTDSVSLDTSRQIAWEQLYKDTVLTSLIRMGLENNTDMRIAAVRIEEAGLIVGNVKALLYPSVNYNASIGGGTLGTSAQKTGTAIDGNTYKALGVLNWEADLWGKIRRSQQAALAGLLATQSNRDALRISLIGQIAELYFLLRDLDNRLLIARKTLSNRKESTKIISDRFAKGYIAELEKFQAEQQEKLAEVTIPRFQRQISETENALRLICGQFPGYITRGMKNSEDVIISDIPAGLPSQLLQRRPDIIGAEANLRAQFERIGIAQANVYPRISLTGLLGFASPELNTFINNKGLVATGLAGMVGPVFQFGTNKRNIEIERARTEGALQQYNETVLNAFREVNDAIVRYNTYKQEHAIWVQQVELSKKSLELTRALYDYGYNSYIDVMIQENNLFDAELQESVTLQQQLTSLALLYKTLGGGW